MITLEHALALFLFIGVPIWDVLETRALKTGTNPRRKIFCYRRIVAVEWIAVLAAWIAFGSSVVFVWPAVRQTTPQKIGTSFAWGFAVAFVAGSLLQVVLTRRSGNLRDKTLKAFKGLAFILPVTQEERSWFALVSVTAGICEEVLYRGFSDQISRRRPLAHRPLDRASGCEHFLWPRPRLSGIIRDHRHRTAGSRDGSDLSRHWKLMAAHGTPRDHRPQSSLPAASRRVVALRGF